MYLYNLTLQKSTNILHAIPGNFSGTRREEILISTGTRIELLYQNPNNDKLCSMASVDLFGIVQSIISFRPAYDNKDLIIIGTDSGKVVILEYMPIRNVFLKLVEEQLLSAGCRRPMPGAYLIGDPKGRAFMISAIERQKLVYLVDRNVEGHLSVASSLETSKANTCVFHTASIDVGDNNPLFANLEMDLKDMNGNAERAGSVQFLVLYELNLVSKQVIKKYSEPLEQCANRLVPVCDNINGTNGLFICFENYINYKSLNDLRSIRCPIPHRRNDLNDPERGLLIICTAIYQTESVLLFLVQTEQGDLFKVSLETESNIVTKLKLKYFDTIPPASAICILNSGFLFAASEFGDNYLYEIIHLGDADEEPEFGSAIPLEDGETIFFSPRGLRNLVLIEEMTSLSPVLDFKLANLESDDGDNSGKMIVACGGGPRSTIRILRHNLDVTEVAISLLPGNPNAVWTVKRRARHEYDTYIVVSFENATLVLSVGPSIEEVSDSGFLVVTPTLFCSAFGDDALVQVYPDGVRHIRSDKSLQDWRAPSNNQIVKCAVNQQQVVISLFSGELVYFEMDPAGLLKEYSEHKQMESVVVCMALANAPSSQQMSQFLAVGLADQTVQIISLESSTCLATLCVQNLPDAPESLCIVEMGSGISLVTDVATNSTSNFVCYSVTIYLYIGLQNGVFLRTVLDPVNGIVPDIHTRYIGTQPVKLFQIKIQGNNAVLMISNKCWLSYNYHNRFHLTPLLHQELDHVSGFSSEQCPEGLVAISTNMLKIISIENIASIFSQVTFPLEMTPRKFVVHPVRNNLVIVETDHNTFTEDVKNGRYKKMAEEMKDVAKDVDQELAEEMAKAFISETLPESVFSSPKASTGMWASLIRVMSPLDGQTHQVIRLVQNEAAISICLCKFSSEGNQEFIVVGVVNHLRLNPRKIQNGYLFTYRVNATCTNLELVHRTLVEEIPSALCSFYGSLLVAGGNSLQLFEMGKSSLIKKCEGKCVVPNLIVDMIALSDKHICVTDVQESVHFVYYKNSANGFILFADDVQPRWVSAVLALDQATVAVADKFGNICLVRLPVNVKEEVNEDTTSNRALWDKALVNGAPQKADCIASVHIGQMVKSIQKGELIPGRPEVLIYATLTGSIGVLIPFSTKDEQEFFKVLETQMQLEDPSLSGRNHLCFRSAQYPLKNVIDGTLCEQYNDLDTLKQKEIAEQLGRSPNDIIKRLEDIRIKNVY